MKDMAKKLIILFMILVYLAGVMADQPKEDDPRLEYGKFWSTFGTNWKTSWDSKPKGVTTFLQSTSHAQSGMSRMFYDPQDPTWSQQNDGMMATVLGGMDRWKQEMCREKAQNLDSGANQASVVLGAQGSSYAHIEGERTTALNDTGEEYLYVITYGISAYECDMTVDIYLDDEKIAGSFKLEAPSYSPDADEDKEKKKNSTRSDRYVNYSMTKYTKACIRFEKDPWCLVGLDGKEICNSLTEASENTEEIPGSEDLWPFG